MRIRDPGWKNSDPGSNSRIRNTVPYLFCKWYLSCPFYKKKYKLVHIQTT
jgi:hypothetical protein